LSERAGVFENRGEAREGSQDIRWTGFDVLRLAMGVAYAVRDELALELQLDCAIGSFRHVRTASFVSYPGTGGTGFGFDADLREDTRKPYVVFGLSLAARGFLP
jgi:hypothetical protein